MEGVIVLKHDSPDQPPMFHRDAFVHDDIQPRIDLRYGLNKLRDRRA
jgi:hypothetical protein